MLNLRLAAAAAVAASLAGCSFFGFGTQPVKPQQSAERTAHRPAPRVQLAALPDYLSDEDLSAVTAPLPRAGGFLGVPPRRPEPATGRATAQPSAPPRKLTLARVVPAQPLADLRPVTAALEPRSFTLADLLVDQAWRQRTSRNLERLFQ